MHSKGNYYQGERQPSEWEKITANETTDKGINCQYIHSKPEKQTDQSKSRKKNLN